MTLPTKILYKEATGKPILISENGKEFYCCPICSKKIRKNLANFFCHTLIHTHPRCPVCKIYMKRNNQYPFTDNKYNLFYFFYQCEKCQTICLIPKAILGKGYLKTNRQQ